MFLFFHFISFYFHFKKFEFPQSLVWFFRIVQNQNKSLYILKNARYNWPQSNWFSSTFLIYIEVLSGAVRKLRNWKLKICEQKIAYFHATPKPIWNIFREMVRTQFNLPLKWFSTSKVIFRWITLRPNKYMHYYSSQTFEVNLNPTLVFFLSSVRLLFKINNFEFF